MIKLRFANPLIELDGRSTIMRMCATIFINKLGYKSKEFTRKVTLKDGDNYDLNFAALYLRTLIETDAYIWAKFEVEYMFKREKQLVENFEKFISKASYVISHDAAYLMMKSNQNQ